MKNLTRYTLRTCLVLLFLCGTTNANAQFFKKLGKAIQKAANTINDITQPQNESTTRTMKVYKQPSTSQDSSAYKSKAKIAEESLGRWNNAAQTAAQKNSSPSTNKTTTNNTSKLGGKMLPGQKIALAVQQLREYEKQFYINDTIYKKELLGEYKAFTEMKKIYALVDKNTGKPQAFLVEPAYLTDYWGGKNPLVKIANTSTLYPSLQKLVSKYKEWQKTADSNNVGTFEKEIDIEIPIETLTFYRGNEIHAGKWNNKKFIFFRKYTDKPAYLKCIGEWKGLNSDCNTMGICFKNEQEITDFIEFFNPTKFKRLIEIQKQGGLFH